MNHDKELEVATLAQELCRIPSITGDEQKVVSFVEELMLSRGFIVRRQPVQNSTERDNLFICSPENLTPEVLLSTHLDTVAPFFPPRIEEGMLISRGACDAKGIAAAMICAFSQLVASGENRVGLLFLVGEETNSDGAKMLSHDFVPSVNYVINGEPTDLKLVKGMKGVLAFKLSVTGKSGHSAYPESGKSAVHQLCKDIAALLNEPWPSDDFFGETTLNIGKIDGGHGANVIADYATASGVMRITTDAEKMLERMFQLIHPDTELEIKSQSQPQALHTLDGYEVISVSFGSDVPFLRKIGTPLLIGPGSILDAHTSHDQVELADLRRAVEIYREIATQLMGTQ